MMRQGFVDSCLVFVAKAYLSEDPVDLHLGCQAYLSEGPVDLHLGCRAYQDKIWKWQERIWNEERADIRRLD